MASLLSKMRGSNSNEPHPAAAELLRNHVKVLPPIHGNGQAIAQKFDDFSNCRVLMIGDASHGTSEFYEARAEITKYMVEHHGFDIIAVEADWPDADAVDRYVRRRPGFRPPVSVRPGGIGEEERVAPFKRFPTWMWRNMEVHDFVEWLRAHNKGHEPTKAVGFYGLDLYSLGASMKAVIDYLDMVDSEMAKVARQRYGKLMVWAEDPHEYGIETLMTAFKGYEREVIEMLRDLLSKRLEYSAHWKDGMEFHSAEQNARLVADAERYYKAMYYGRDESWNLRDTHMFETLVRILKHRGLQSKAVVWAHNSHLGDARATGMGQVRDEINIGQLCKETFRKKALSIGCGTNTGTVAAADRWDGDMKIMEVNPGLPNSYEELMHSVGLPNFMLDLRKGHCDEQVREELSRNRLERFIGVIYRPDAERQSHYSIAELPAQFDAFLWFDKTKAVRSFEVNQPPAPLEYDETWPFGL